MTNAQYHAHAAVSKSDLDLINRSPLHYKAAKEQPAEQTEAMLIGSVVHKLVLEPDGFPAEYAIAPKCDRRTSEGKAIWKEFVMNCGERTTVSAENYRKAKAIADSVLSNTAVQKLLTGGHAEQSYFWTDADTGIECKCRPDYLRSSVAVDLKTTNDASPEGFIKSAYNYRYHVQAWWYLHGLQANGIDVRDFVFIAVEKEPPFAVCLYAADDLMLQLGEREAKANLHTYAECISSGLWHGYDSTPTIHSLSLPDWVIRKEF